MEGDGGDGADGDKSIVRASLLRGSSLCEPQVLGVDRGQTEVKVRS